MLGKYRIDGKRNASLQEYDPEDTAGLESKEAVQKEFHTMKEELQEEQEKLYASKAGSVLVLFQGMDCSGKDGVVKKVLSGLNPQGFHAESFKKPTGDEAAHDFLWRAHRVTPAKGYVASFNRSYYEDVLITRVHGNVTEKEALHRLKHILNFEQLLADSGTKVIKIFLHISREFQLKKIQERMENPEKLWKFDPSDLQERRYWDQYVLAYEDVFEATGTKESPWYIVPSNRRWFRDYLVLKIILDAFRDMKLSYPMADLTGMGLPGEPGS
jgi:PPK2 family polyphosphate:nucleotide phosphotransferase